MLVVPTFLLSFYLSYDKREMYGTDEGTHTKISQYTYSQTTENTNLENTSERYMLRSMIRRSP